MAKLYLISGNLVVVVVSIVVVVAVAVVVVVFWVEGWGNQEAAAAIKQRNKHFLLEQNP